MFHRNLKLTFLICLFSGLSVQGAIYGSPWNEFVVKSNGNTIGKSYAPNAPIFSSSGYYFTLLAPNDGVSTTAQVRSQTLYYTTPDCSGDTYISSSMPDGGIPLRELTLAVTGVNYVPNSISGGNIFVGYSDVEKKSLFYVPRNSQFSQLKSLSYRDNNRMLRASISFKDPSNWQNALANIPKSGQYVLNFGGYSTEKINWNDTVEQIKTKIITGIPIISSLVQVSSTGTPLQIGLQYQTDPQNSFFNFTVSENTLKDARSGKLIDNVFLMKTLPGTCVVQNQASGIDVLNRPLTRVMPNDPAKTGVSDIDFLQPITYEQNE